MQLLSEHLLACQARFLVALSSRPSLSKHYGPKHYGHSIRRRSPVGRHADTARDAELPAEPTFVPDCPTDTFAANPRTATVSGGVAADSLGAGAAARWTAAGSLGRPFPCHRARRRPGYVPPVALSRGSHQCSGPAITNLRPLSSVGTIRITCSFAPSSQGEGICCGRSSTSWSSSGNPLSTTLHAMVP